MTKLADPPRAALVGRDRYSALLRNSHAPSGFLPDLLARVRVRYPEVPIVFVATRPLAEEWTYRWLSAALAESIAAAEAWGDEDAPEDPGPQSDAAT